MLQQSLNLMRTYGLKRKGLCIFMMSLNLIDLALNKKRISKTITFSFVRRRKLNVSLPVGTTLSQTVKRIPLNPQNSRT